MTHLQITEMLKVARNKAANLTPNTSIRVSADVRSYTVFNIEGKTFIGSYTSEPMPKLFKNREVRELMDNKTGRVSATMQSL